jgi:ABC-type polysaccharide/polyol phosphate export permease
MTSSIPALLKRRSLIRTLTVSNLKQAHRNTVLGYAWWLLDPIMMTVVYTVVVGFIRGRGRMIPAYPAFAMAGLLLWKCFANTIVQSINVVSRSEGIIKSFHFPKAALPLSLALANHILLLFAFIPLLCLVLFYRYVMGAEALSLGPTLVLAPVVLVVEFTLCLGGALMFSCFGAFFRDLGNLMTHLLRMGWYMSPGLYTIASVVGDYAGLLRADWSDPRSLYLLNPFAHVMTGFRDCLMYNRLPDLPGIAFALVFGILSIAVGFWVFRRTEPKFAKVV